MGEGEGWRERRVKAVDFTHRLHTRSRTQLHTVAQGVRACWFIGLGQDRCTALVLGLNPQHFAGGLTVQWWSRAASVPAGGAARDETLFEFNGITAGYRYREGGASFVLSTPGGASFQARVPVDGPCARCPRGRATRGSARSVSAIRGRSKGFYSEKQCRRAFKREN